METDPASLAMISTLFVVMIAGILHQARENTKTRELIVRTNNETRTELRGDIQTLDTRVAGLDTRVAGLDTRVTELKHTTEKNHDELKRTTEKNHDELKRTTEKNHDELKRTTENSYNELKRTTEKNHDELRHDHNELKRAVENNHDVLRKGQSDTGERLARIEGHLRIGAPPNPEPTPPE